MSTTHARGDAPTVIPVGTFDQRVEVIVIPVSDVDRSKRFYRRLGWRLDVTPPGVVQLTPPGSSCSVQFGTKLSSAAPGSAKAYLVVSDIVAAREAMIAAGVQIGEIFHLGPNGPVPGPDPNRSSYVSRAMFNDPDGNLWLMQQITGRLPGRVEVSTTTFASVDDLRAALQRAADAYAQHQARPGEHDLAWSEWYARFMAAQQAGTTLPL
jgi:catechol 2,3-dioxygenase-like lactoylglutathione lyase family enzyme